MDWKKVAIEDLQKYKHLIYAKENIAKQIKTLTDDFTAVKSSASAEPVRGGGNRQEDNLLNNIVRRERLKINYNVISRLKKQIDAGLENLTADERLVLQTFYFSDYQGRNNGINNLMDKLGYEKSKIYNIRNEALRKFTLSMYGVIDL